MFFFKTPNSVDDPIIQAMDRVIKLMGVAFEKTYPDRDFKIGLFVFERTGKEAEDNSEKKEIITKFMSDLGDHDMLISLLQSFVNKAKIIVIDEDDEDTKQTIN